MVAFIHFSGTKNIGDNACPPYLYFDFPNVEVFNLRNPVPSRSIMIYGGGALGYELEKEAPKFKSSLKITWGVGISRHGETRPGRAPDGFQLFGSREWRQENTVYALCASCMSPLFDRQYPITSNVVFYVNSDPWIQGKFPTIISDLPTMTNEKNLSKAIAFLGSAETVVTNSYHGAYWATLLGCKVVLYKPYSSKFFSFKFQPVTADADDWRTSTGKAVCYPEALEDSRTTTLKFYAHIRELIANT